MKKYLHTTSVVLLLFLTVALRFYRWEEKFSFNAEYNYKLWPMYKLITEKPTLIGIEAVSYLHHIHYPPLFLYLFSPILWMNNYNPASIEIALILLSPATAYLFFKLGEKLHNRQLGYLLTFLYAISFLAQRSDRFIWVVGPIIGLTVFIFLILLHGLQQRKIDGRIGFILGCTVGVGLNFHYQMMLLPITFMLSLLYQPFRQIITKKAIIAFVIGCVIFLLPLLIFDLRHEFYNLTGIKLLIAYASEGLVPDRQIISAINAFSSIFLGLFVPSAHPAALVSENTIVTIATTFLIFLLFFRVVQIQQNENTRLFLQFTWLLSMVGLISFGLIRNNFNYYLIILEPVFILFVAFVLIQLKKTSAFPSTARALVFVVFITNNLFHSLTFKVNPSWKQQVAAIDFMLTKAQQKPVSIHFAQSASEEYLFLLYYRALRNGIDFSNIIYYEPWQDGSRAEFVIQPKTNEEKQMHFGTIVIAQRN